MKEKEITPADFSRVARRKVGLLHVEARHRTDSGDVVTILRSTEGFVPKRHNVIFTVRGSQLAHVDEAQEQEHYPYREIQVTGDTSAVFRQGIGIYESGAYAVDSLPVLIGKTTEDSHAARKDDLRAMYDIAVDLGGKTRLDVYGRRTQEQKADSVFARNFAKQGERLLVLAQCNGMDEYIPKEKYDFSFAMHAADYVTSDYYYAVLDMVGKNTDKLSIAECCFDGQYQEGNITVFPALTYQLDRKTQQIRIASQDRWFVRPDGSVGFETSLDFKTDETGRNNPRSHAVTSQMVRTDLLTRLMALGEVHLTSEAEKNAVFAMHKR